MNTIKKIIIIITGIAILIAGILCKQEFFLMIPLFISLFVMAFQSDANRIGLLIGAVNAVIYTATYIYIGVYGSAASAFLFSFPIQLASFFNWKKNSYKNTVMFKKMTNKQRVLFLSAVLLAWAISSAILIHLEYEYAVLDSISFLLGFITPVLTMFAYIEYTYLWIISAFIGLLLNVQMVINDYKQTTYLIYGIYALYCVIGAFITVRKYYKEQQELKSASLNINSEVFNPEN